MRTLALLALAVSAALAASLAEARITKIQYIEALSSAPSVFPGQGYAFGGYSWPDVGRYEKLVGIAFGEVNPHDRRNRVIVDLDLAKPNNRGNVEYSFNFYILKPADLSKGAHRVMYEPPNRGGKTWSALGRVSGGGDDPASITDTTVLANSFLMPRGYTMVWSGWEELGPLNTYNASAGFPIVYNADGSPITGPSYEYIITGGTSFALAYPAANLDKSKATLTHRIHLNDPPEIVPGYGTAACAAPVTKCWDYGTSAGTLAAAAASGATNIKVSTVTGLNAGAIVMIDTGAAGETVTVTSVGTAGAAGTGVTFAPALANAHAAGAALLSAAATSIRLRLPAGGTVPFTNNDIYELAYTAKDPSPKGLGFAAVRDWNSWLRSARRDDFGTPNPLAGDIQKIYTEISSQPGRLLNDFRHLGFNEDENGRRVFDGHMQWIAAGNGINMNYRFSQSGRTERNRQNHLYIEGRFPFANVRTYDPITRKVDSRYASCQETRTCPLGMEIYSANEYWVKAASLLHTDPTGSRDLHDSKYTRNYFMSSMRHGTGNSANKGLCQQFDNPLNSAPVQRALFIALDEWATNGRKPPKSRVPKLKDGTLVPPLPQSGMGFPNIPGVTYTGLKTTRYHFDYGLHFYETGIATVNPPVFPFTTPSYQDDPGNGPIYPSYIPKTDSDGNDIAGVRLPDVRVPLATYTGWALRSGVWANDGCEAAGQYIPFPATADASDPRRSVAARYPAFDGYYAKAVKAIDDMVGERLLLCEDAQAELDRMVAHATTRGVSGAHAVSTPQAFPACQPKKGRGHHDRDDDDEDDDNDNDNDD